MIREIGLFREISGYLGDCVALVFFEVFGLYEGKEIGWIFEWKFGVFLGRGKGGMDVR